MIRQHLAEEEGHEQRSDVGAVDICIGHDDDPLIAQLVGVEITVSSAASAHKSVSSDLPPVCPLTRS